MLYEIILTGVVCYGLVLLFTWKVNQKRFSVKNVQDPSEPFPSTTYKFPLGDTSMYKDYDSYVKSFNERFRKWGCFMIYIANQPIHFLIKPDYIKEVLTKPEELFSRNFQLDYLSDFFGAGLIGVVGETWKKQHRIIQKALSTTNIINFFPLFHEVTLKRLAEVEKAADEGTPIDMNRIMNEIAGEVIIQSAFGCKGQQADEMAASFKGLLLTYNPLFRIPGFLKLNFLPFVKKHNDEKHRIISLANAIVDERRAIWKHRKEQQARGEPVENSGVSYLVDLLFDAQDEETGAYLTDEELKDNARTFLGAGSETTATAMSWFLYNLTRNPDVWAKVIEEVDQVVPDDLSQFSYQHLAKYSYLNQVITESLRVNPSVSLITPRIPTEDIQVGPWSFPRGSWISFSIPVVHFSPDNYEDPYAFKPERWEDNADRKLPYTYVAFGTGRRVCIGKYFALLEMRIVLSIFLKKFSFQRVPKPDGSPNNDKIEKLYLVPVLHLKDGLPLLVKRRQPKTQ